MIPIVSKYNPLKRYKWGNNCDGWNLADEAHFSVKQERMPAGTSEARHYHQYAQQFFYIVKSTATFQIEGEIYEVHQNEGLHIKAGLKHQIINNTSEDIEFILFSQPSTTNDRMNCNE